MEHVLALDAPARYDHFIKQAADRNMVWGLWNDGWAMGEDDNGNPTFPIWPAAEYAELCAKSEWADYEAAEIPLDDLLEELLPKLQEDSVQPSIFQTPNGVSVMPRIEQLLADLRNEKSRYE